MDNWKDSYGAVVAEIISRRTSSIDELCDKMDLMRDQIEDIAGRLEARGVIERDVRDHLVACA